jgi:D-gamma-glutamyl-meso-diaminopimelic acid endopeptidase CwlS/peptidoglycan endopeptidase LytF/peptidoglycan endopeptidase LytE
MKRVLPIFVFLTILFILNLNAYSYINIITVSPGATLGQIADNYNTSVNSIMSLNGLHNYVIYPGEKLKVPVNGSYQPVPQYGHYTVQFGDTLSLIAQKYGTSIAELRKLNHLYSNVIRTGAVLVVPKSYVKKASYKVVDNNGLSRNKLDYFGNKNVSKKSKYQVATFKVVNSKRCSLNDNESSGKKTDVIDNLNIGQKIVDIAYKYQGVPYVWGGTTRSGMDCSGFSQHVFDKLGIDLPRTAAEQARLGKYVPKNKLKPGDLLFFRTYAPYISHVGIYIGHGKFIQENSGAGMVTINSLNNEYFKRTYAFAKSIK